MTKPLHAPSRKRYLVSVLAQPQFGAPRNCASPSSFDKQPGAHPVHLKGNDKMTDPTPQPVAPQPAVPLTPAEDNQWASFAHLGGIIGFLPSLIIWLVFKDRGAFTKTEAKEALNFQITATIAYVVLNILGNIIGILTFGLGFVFNLLVFLVWVASIIFSIMGFLSAKDGKGYRYPVSIRLIK